MPEYTLKILAGYAAAGLITFAIIVLILFVAYKVFK